jgi:hypothetical protein
MNAVFAGTRFPRSMLPSEAAERLLTLLGVQIVDDVDAELAEIARAWLATAKPGNAESAAAIRKVREALEGSAE